MIRCGAFCLCTEPAVAEAAMESARKLERRSKAIRERKDLRSADGDDLRLVSLDFEGDGLPAVHGWVGHSEDEGEFSKLAATELGLEASRDYCGTRPLYVAGSRRWVASDHRFFPGEPKELIPPGASYLVTKGQLKLAQDSAKRFSGTFDEASQRLASLVSESVRIRVEGKRIVAVAFSGGLDSSILALCANKHTKVVACSVAAEGSRDSKTARETASVMGLDFVGALVDREAIRRELRSQSLPFAPTSMDDSLWCIYSIAGRLAFEAGAEVLLLGQLADELLGGYAKYEVAAKKDGDAAAERMMSRDVSWCGTRGFLRDEAACSIWSEPRFPFAERELAMFAGALPVSFKIREGLRKAVLREAALRLGVPDEIARTPKKAAQYSSGVLKLLGSV